MKRSIIKGNHWRRPNQVKQGFGGDSQICRQYSLKRECDFKPFISLSALPMGQKLCYVFCLVMIKTNSQIAGVLQYEYSRESPGSGERQTSAAHSQFLLDCVTLGKDLHFWSPCFYQISNGGEGAYACWEDCREQPIWKYAAGSNHDPFGHQWTVLIQCHADGPVKLNRPQNKIKSRESRRGEWYGKRGGARGGK